MSDQLTCEVERTHPVALVRLRGVLDLSTATQARSALLAILDDEPVALIVDVAGLTVGDELAVALLPTLCERAELWPGALMLLCSPDPALASALQRVGASRPVPWYPSLEDALSVVASLPLPPRVIETLEPDIAAPARARELVTATCAEWGVPDLAPVAQLVATELVSNGVTHARTPLVFTVMLSNDRLYVAVHDKSPDPARMRVPATDLDEHGRGLLVVDALASSWGTLPTPAGKIVWAAVGGR